MDIYLAITHTYSDFTIGIFSDDKLVDYVSDTSHNTSKNLIPMIDTLVENQGITLQDISFIAVNYGPGPFTTLRSIIATANGIGFATSIPLVGVDGMKALLREYHSSLFPITIGLLNAFNQDLYFGIADHDKPIEVDYKNHEQLFNELSQRFAQQTIRFIGSGVELYKKQIIEQFGQWAEIPQPLPYAASVTQIGYIGLQQFKDKKNIFSQLEPQYLKHMVYKK